MDFNPRPHAGDDDGDQGKNTGGTISTHVPTRGTTLIAYRVEQLERFQPTSPRGGRPPPGRSDGGGPKISTHVPTRGTT